MQTRPFSTPLLAVAVSRRSLWTPGSGYRPRRDDPHKRPTLMLREGADTRIRRGHPWVFPREVLDPGGLEAHSPCLVNVQAFDGEVLGVALYNRCATIAARLLSTSAFVPVDTGFFVDRLRRSLAYRDRLFPEPFYRLVHGEADSLPGLIVDRYGDHVCVQPTAAGLDALLWPIADALDEVLNPAVIIIRQDAPGRRREQAALKREVLKGQYRGPTELRENSVTFVVDVLEGQKTGWYFDHRDHRARLAVLASCTPRVLDLYSYTGGFGVTLAQYGAEEVVCVDSSENALELCRRAAAMNSVGDRVRVVRSDAFVFLEGEEELGKYDLVIVDPPNLGGDRGKVPGALRFYERLVTAAAAACASPAFLFVASCTHHIDEEALLGAASRALRWARRPARVVDVGSQSADHPGHPALPESRYLRSLLFHLD